MSAAQQPSAAGQHEPASAGQHRAAPAGAEDVARLERTVALLVRHVGHWETGRWSAPAQTAAPGAGQSRADRVHALVQRLADAAAGAEGEALRPVPRLADQVLPDQLRVMADDLVAAGAPAEAVTDAADDVDEVRRTL